MKDVTASLFAGGDTRQTPSVSQLTRLSLIEGRLARLKEKLNLSCPVLTLVVTGRNTLVQKETGSIETAEELIGFYNETHVIQVSVRPRQNAVILYLARKLNPRRD
ncbi:hypothetical protein D3Z51_03610 [Clostridiaceae bacterium]|nr:hypothetical protein [Clostridiaceae bacterium]RKI16870.1 hypothetical protein D7V81_03890 [bacterium 1XD21-70]